MSINELMQTGANVSITVTPADLKEFALAIIDEAKEMAKIEKEPEVSVLYGVSENTLWRWNCGGYLYVVKLGRKNFYRKSDVEKLRG